jgi:hypothetical protein
MDLASQEYDLVGYLAGIGGSMEEILAAWDLLEPWKQYLPNGVMGSEKALYSSDLRTLISLLKHRFGVDVPGQGA